MQTRLLVIALLLLGFLGCKDSSTGSNPVPPAHLSPLEKEIISSDNSFGLDLFKKINQNSSNSNVVISPLSVSMAFGMALNGADGSTKTAIQNVLGYGGYADTAVNLSYRSILDNFTALDQKTDFEIANSIWYRNGLPVEQAFLDVNKNYFDAEVQGLNFSDPNSASVINGWVNLKTKGLIPTIIDPPIPSDMVMYLINALYFKGTWTTAFDSAHTQNGTFTTGSGVQQQCRMMVMEDTLNCYGDQTVQIVRMPYGNGSFEMDVILPENSGNIDGFISSLTGTALDGLLMQPFRQKGTLLLPRFKLEYKRKLNDDLITMGMGVAFDQNNADFSRIARMTIGRLYIDEVLHKTYIEVDEAGTKAAAVTSIGIVYTSVGPGEFIMIVNRPFVFCIRETNSGALMFVGKVTAL